MFKPIRWKTFPRDFLRIQSGFLLFALAITLMIRGNLGTSAWAVLEVALASKLHISILLSVYFLYFPVLVNPKARGVNPIFLSVNPKAL